MNESVSSVSKHIESEREVVEEEQAQERDAGRSLE
jgi:hypothetical protein